MSTRVLQTGTYRIEFVGSNRTGPYSTICLTIAPIGFCYSSLPRKAAAKKHERLVMSFFSKIEKREYLRKAQS